MKKGNKRVVFDEGYAIVILNDGELCLEFVPGRRINEGYALTYNHWTYTCAITHIDSGRGVDGSYFVTKLGNDNSCYVNIDIIMSKVSDVMRLIDENEHYKNQLNVLIKEYNQLMNDKVFC